MAALSLPFLASMAASSSDAKPTYPNYPEAVLDDVLAVLSCATVAEQIDDFKENLAPHFGSRSERCCITPLAYSKMSKAQREGYPEEGWTAYAVRKEKEMEANRSNAKRRSAKQIEVTGCFQPNREKAEADGQVILEAYASGGMTEARQMQRQIMAGMWGTANQDAEEEGLCLAMKAFLFVAFGTLATAAPADEEVPGSVFAWLSLVALDVLDALDI
eukprot:Skav235107  [mRNA]  locus=scaffold711:258795:265209:+ [translate_table: standard]